MSPLPPAGWYPDPERALTQRYWDGSHWTPHRAPASMPGDPPPARPRVAGKVLAAAVGVAGLIVVASLAAWAAADPGLEADVPLGRAGQPSAPAAVATTPTAGVQARPTPSATGRPTAPRPTQVPTKATAGAGSAAGAAGLVAVSGVVDGDTIKVRLGGSTERVRVIGIDTPELASSDCYAQEAASRMQSLVQSKSVRLVADPTQADRDRYGRLLRHVQLADGRSVAQVLIAGGFGEEYTYDRAYAGQAAYRSAEAAARAARRGIWGGACATAPAPAPQPRSPAAPQSCTIKGNIASDGDRIYHLPGQQYYAVTVITESKGERWFCTEAEAVSAGWRASKR